MGRNFEVQYIDLRTGEPTGETVKVRAVTRNKTTELAALVESLLSKFFYYGRMPGEVLRPDNVGVWSDMRKIVAMLPLEGGGELDLDRVDDDQLLKIFFTNSTCIDEEGALTYDKDGGERSLMPSEICKINGISFFNLSLSHKGVINKALERERQMRESEFNSQMSELKAEASPATPTPTPSPSSSEPTVTTPVSPSTSGKTSRKPRSTTSSTKLAS